MNDLISKSTLIDALKVHLQLKNDSGEIELNSITINCTNSSFCNFIKGYLRKEN